MTAAKCGMGQQREPRRSRATEGAVYGHCSGKMCCVGDVRASRKLLIMRLNNLQFVALYMKCNNYDND